MFNKIGKQFVREKSLDLLQKSIPFALSLSKGGCRTCSSTLRQAQGEREDGSKTTYARSLLFHWPALFVSQRDNRIKRGGFPRRIKAEKDADPARKHECDADNPRIDDNRNAEHLPNAVP